ncbi:MAG: SDR family oxidoreductase [Planctomycetes bacterium]|nr:SDR family oxidoreductase [Planctomycetota bacterium]
MDLGLRDRTVLVTGGSRGIGRAVACAFHEEGARVVICSRSARHLVEAAKEIGEVVAIPCDVRRPGEIRRLMRRAGPLDVLVNNAGGMEHFARFDETTPARWRSTFELNLHSAVEVTRAALAGLKRRRGCVINVASEVGRQPFGMGPDYCAAKAALLNLTKYLANELATNGIRVNAICPGPVLTDSWIEDARRAGGSRWKRHLAADLEHALRRVPLGRVGRPADVGGLAVFLASPRASWITGAAFAVDGGALRVMA